MPRGISQDIVCEWGEGQNLILKNVNLRFADEQYLKYYG